MKLFRRTTPAAPPVPRESLTSDPDVLSTIWSVWLAAQPVQDQEVLATHDRSGHSESLAVELAADPVRKLEWLRTDPSMEPEIQSLAEGLLDGATLGDVPWRLGRVAGIWELERTLTTDAVREAIAERMTPAGAEATAFVIALLVGTEFGAADMAPRRVLIARGVILVGLLGLGLPIDTWEARLRKIDREAKEAADAIEAAEAIVASSMGKGIDPTIDDPASRSLALVVYAKPVDLKRYSVRA